MTNRGTKFCFTDFGCLNWKQIYELHHLELRFVAWGEEVCPTTKKKHLQGFLQTTKTMRFAAIKKLCGYPGLHLEVLKGSFRDNERYCSKEGSYTCLGQWVTQGQRTDLETVMDDIVETKGDLDHIMETHPEQYVKYHGGIDKLCMAQQKKHSQKWMMVQTHILTGRAGTGKTSHVFKKHGYDNVFTLDSDADPKFLLDGYRDERVLLIDDFVGNIRYSTLLRLLDGHPMKLNVKNGRAYKAWHYVYITSNVAPALWYTKPLGENMIRRFDSWHEVDKGVILNPLSLDTIHENYTRWDSYGGET